MATTQGFGFVFSGKAWAAAALFVALQAAAPASAGWLDGFQARRDDCAPCTRHRSAETQCEHEKAKHLNDLDCRGLLAYAEALRFGYNRQALATYQGAGPASRSVPAPGPGPESMLNARPGQSDALPPPPEAKPDANGSSILIPAPSPPGAVAPMSGSTPTLPAPAPSGGNTSGVPPTGVVPGRPR